ncbi:hypothetical protein GCM10010983_12630 [Caulobacter rhizosphaerae]|nr:hypothetical protein GCM10010983_12630 [Caulobacter rhizosphaerae]
MLRAFSASGRFRRIRATPGAASGVSTIRVWYAAIGGSPVERRRYRAPDGVGEPPGLLVLTVAALL